MENYKVYCHTAPNGKKYIGITSSRLVTSRWKAGNGYNKQQKFYNAIKKYGWNNFKHEVLYDNLSRKDAMKKEQELIKLYKSDSSQYGYNISIGGELGAIIRPHKKKENYIEKHPKKSLICNIYQFDNEFNVINRKLIIAEDQYKLADYLRTDYKNIQFYSNGSPYFKKKIDNSKSEYIIENYNDLLYRYYEKFGQIDSEVILWKNFKPKEYEMEEKYGTILYKENMSC